MGQIQTKVGIFMDKKEELMKDKFGEKGVQFLKAINKGDKNMTMEDLGRELKLSKSEMI